jgi:hypothetical protein
MSEKAQFYANVRAIPIARGGNGDAVGPQRGRSGLRPREEVSAAEAGWESRGTSYPTAYAVG